MKWKKQAVNSKDIGLKRYRAAEGQNIMIQTEEGGSSYPNPYNYMTIMGS